jgi:murein DD-endopeptidase MepM/ murein hydrolase activator NlpD
VLQRCLALTAALLLIPALSATPAAAHHDGGIIDLTYPVADPEGRTSFIDDFRHSRGERIHGATDIMGPKHLRIHAAVGGTVSFTPYPEPSYGWLLSINGDDGHMYRYLHLNNDARDGSGRASLEETFAPKIAEAIRAKGTTLQASDGIRVARGEHIAYLGDSGAEWAPPHLHFEIFAQHSQNSTRINPYESLRSALQRGDVPGAAFPQSEAGFVDVDPNGAHGAAIDRLVSAGVLVGCGPNRYCPNDPLMRGHLATAIAVVLDLPDGDGTRFDDVDANHPNATEIGAVADARILTGYGNGRFGADRPLSREQLASVLVDAFRLDSGSVKGATAAERFTDVSPNGAHAHNIAITHAKGLTVGCGDGTRYCGRQDVTRGQIASFLENGIAAAR